MASANLFAYFALLLWVPVSLGAFTFLRPPVACAALFLGSTMFLPIGVGFDLPKMPPLQKEELASLFILAGGIVRCRRRLFSARPGRGLEVLVFVFMIGAVGTSLTNKDPLTYGRVTLPPLRLYDAFSDGVRDLLTYAVPFFLGRAFFRDRRDLRDLFLLIVVAGIVYSLPTLVELRLSPQLHRWTYGYFQRAFSGTERYGGYRPMVYMANGLALALFFAAAATASSALGRSNRRREGFATILRVPAGLVTGYLVAILVLCKSFASISYGVMGVALTSLLTPRALARAASILAILVASYPVARATDVFPVGPVLSVAKAIDEQRWDSLEFRFRHEENLLTKARERSVFGWGGYRRSRIFDDRGKDISITDGFWIIMFGTRGFVGFLCTFGLLVIPVLSANLRLAKIPENSDRVLVASLSLIVAFHALDLIPNGLFSFLPMFFSGALVGVLPGVSSHPRSIRRAAPRDAGSGETRVVPEPVDAGAVGKRPGRTRSLWGTRR